MIMMKSIQQKCRVKCNTCMEVLLVIVSTFVAKLFYNY